MKSSYYTGLLFLTPAVIFVFLFFLAPVVLTGVFSFTNMSTATGIMGGEYRLSPVVMRDLKAKGFDATLLARLTETQCIIDEAGLDKARKTGADGAAIKELAERHIGERFKNRRDLERMLKKLDNRPSSIREIKKLAASFEQSIYNETYAEKESFLIAISELGVSLSPQQTETLTKASYTGWSWTTINFKRMFGTKDTLKTLINTLIYVFFTLTLFNTGFALLLAITTFYMPKRQAAFFRAVWLLPRISPPVLYVLLWKWLAWDVGFISTVLGWFGMASRNWMLDTTVNAWVFVVLINGFVGASMGMILFSSAIKAIPKQLFYASEVDGASRWQQIKRIIIPQLRWPILFVTSYQTLSLLTSFEYILLSTEGGPGTSTEVWALAAYQIALNNYAGNLEYGFGATLALVLVVIGIFMSLVYLRIFNFDKLLARPLIEQ